VFTPIHAERLTLRVLEPADAEAVFAYRADPGVSRYQGWVPASAAEVRAFIAGLAGIGPDTPGRWFQLGIVLRATGELVGDCGLRVSESEPREVEVGITVAPAFQRRGLAGEALRALLGFLFDGLGKHRVYGSVDPRNTASLAMLERVGMRREAHFVESLWFKGVWADDVVCAMLAREWREGGGTDGMPRPAGRSR
jgi:RimJ/RimL family protein N-acetyltransferase